jgi:hypothetical protein
MRLQDVGNHAMIGFRHTRRTLFAVSGSAIVLLLAGGHDQCCGQDAHSLQQAFLTQAPQAWKEYREWAGGLQGSYTWRSVSRHPAMANHRHAESKYVFKQRKGSAVFLEQPVIDSNEPLQTAMVRVVNPEYGFELRRNAPDAAWVVARYERGLTFKGILAPVHWVGLISTWPVHTALLEVRVDYPPLEPGFKLLKISSVPKGGKVLAKVEFEFRPDKKLDQRLRGGWVLYDPISHWVQRECLLVFERPVDTPENIVKGTHAATFEYDERKSGFPLLKRVITRLEMLPLNGSRDATIEFQLQEAEAPARDFTLSAFGFPDPMDTPQVARKCISWYIWFGLAGFGCLAAAFLLRRGLPWSRRGASEPA